MGNSDSEPPEDDFVHDAEVQVSLLPPVTCRGTQTACHPEEEKLFEGKEIQTDVVTAKAEEETPHNDDMSSTSSSRDTDISASDPEYIPDEEDLENDNTVVDSDIGKNNKGSQPAPEASTSFYEERKYILFQSALHRLLAWVHCPKCGSLNSLNPQIGEVGTLIIMTLECRSCQSSTVWHSHT